MREERVKFRRPELTWCRDCRNFRVDIPLRPKEMLRRSSISEVSHCRPFSHLATCLVLNALAPLAGAAPAKDPSPTLSQNQIHPVFAKSCPSCHSSQSKQGGLDLSSREGLLRGGTRGTAVIPGNAAESLLYKLITR